MLLVIRPLELLQIDLRRWVSEQIWAVWFKLDKPTRWLAVLNCIVLVTNRVDMRLAGKVMLYTVLGCKILLDARCLSWTQFGNHQGASRWDLALQAARISLPQLGKVSEVSADEMLKNQTTFDGDTRIKRSVVASSNIYIYIHISLQVVQSSFPAGGHFWCSQAFLARMQRKLLSGLHHKPEICVQKGFCLNDHSIQAFTKLCAKAEVQCAGLCCSDLSWQVCKLWWLIIWSRNQVPCAFTWFLIRVNRILCETGARRVMVRIE